jgi:prepilin-type N-terminal cleavage/methylation domain-containing protein
MSRRAGFSIVELMVVIFIIGLLAALLLPAIQSARESGRRVHCRNNLKQIGLAQIAIEKAHGRFATDVDVLQREASWITLLFPYLEERALFDEWARTVGFHRPVDNSLGPRRSIGQIYGTPVGIFYCPTRRPAQAYEGSAKTDYALNGGASQGPNDRHVHRPGIWERAIMPEPPYRVVSRKVRAKDVKDGLSHTYLIGEKALSSDNYLTGKHEGERGSIFNCQRGSCVRFAVRTPVVDVPAEESCWNCHNFGSAHLTHWNAAYCDGSVHALSYEMDFLTHKALATRAAADRVNYPD